MPARAPHTRNAGPASMGVGQARWVHTHWPPTHVQVLQPSYIADPFVQAGGGGGGGGGQAFVVHPHWPFMHVHVLQPSYIVVPSVHAGGGHARFVHIHPFI